MACLAAVTLDDVLLRMERGENEQEHILPLEYGEMMLLWQRHCPALGQVVEINTGAYFLRLADIPQLRL